MKHTTKPKVDYISDNNYFVSISSHTPAKGYRSTMHFRPSTTITPLGVRLLELSNRKLTRLEAPVGSRDNGFALLRGVLVREAVRSAWASLEDLQHQDTATTRNGRAAHSEMTDWHAPAAMGLDAITEDDEYDDDEEEDDDEDYYYNDDEEYAAQIQVAEQRWLDDLFSEEDEPEHRGYSHRSELERTGAYPSTGSGSDSEWAETTVSSPIDDDDEYDSDSVESYTLDTLPSPVSCGAEVTVVEVGAFGWDEDEYEEPTAEWQELPLEPAEKPAFHSCDTSESTAVETGVEPDNRLGLYGHGHNNAHTVYDTDITNHDRGLGLEQPTATHALEAPTPIVLPDIEDDAEDATDDGTHSPRTIQTCPHNSDNDCDCDQCTLDECSGSQSPPLLSRSLSSDSNCSGWGDDECVTPPLLAQSASCEDLEEFGGCAGGYDEMNSAGRLDTISDGCDEVDVCGDGIGAECVYGDWFATEPSSASKRTGISLSVLSASSATRSTTTPHRAPVTELVNRAVHSIHLQRSSMLNGGKAKTARFVLGADELDYLDDRLLWNRSEGTGLVC